MRVLYVNPRSGRGHGTAVAGEARRRGIEVLSLGEQAPGAAEIVGVAGGDGSMRGVAAIAVDRDIPFVCVPCGTRNHLARDLGLDVSDPVAALAAFDGVERRIDLGEVDGDVFVNNVSLGAYALLRHRRLHELLDPRRRSAVVDGDPIRAAILLVGNNRYDRLGRRTRLDAGELSVYATGGLLPRVAIERAAERVEITLPGLDRVAAAIDGEAVTLPPRLEPTVRPRALRVLVPPGR